MHDKPKIVGGVLGERVAERTAGGAVFTEVTYPGHYQTERHLHTVNWICLPLQGTLQDRTLRTGDIGAKDLTLLPAGHEHAFRISAGGLRCFNIELPSVLVEHLREEFHFHVEPIIRREESLMLTMQRMRRTFWTSDAWTALSLEGITLELLAEIVRLRHDRHPSWIGMVNDMLRADFTAPLNVPAMAAEVGLSPVHLARSYRRLTGYSLGAMRQRLRIEAAVERLHSSSISIAGLAAELGFSDHSHFTRMFTKMIGVPPSEVRRRHGRKRDPDTER